MRKTVIIQCPSKFFDVVPIFYKEASKHNIFDHFYVVTDFDSQEHISDNITIMKIDQDKQFAGNILYLLDRIPDDIVLLCCEDHVMIKEHSISEFEDAFRFVSKNNSVGALRLSLSKSVQFKNKKANGMFEELSEKYSYYVSLQPTIWRKEFLRSVLKDGEDAWETEIKGSKRAKKQNFRSYGVTKQIFHATNFFKSGKYMRHYFVDYAKNNNIPIKPDMDVFDKKDGRKEVVSVRKYLGR